MLISWGMYITIDTSAISTAEDIVCELSNHQEATNVLVAESDENDNILVPADVPGSGMFEDSLVDIRIYIQAQIDLPNILTHLYVTEKSQI